MEIKWLTSVYSLTDPVFTPGIPCKRNWINDLKPCCVKNIIMLWWLLSKYLSYLHNFYQNMGIFRHVILILFFSRVFWEKNLLTPVVGSKKKPNKSRWKTSYELYMVDASFCLCMDGNYISSFLVRALLSIFF